MTEFLVYTIPAAGLVWALFSLWFDPFFDLFEKVFLSLAAALFAALLAGGGIGIMYEVNKETHALQEYGLKSLDVNSETYGEHSGAFFVSSGYVQSQPYYQFYADLGGGSYKLVSVPATNSTLTETDGAQPSARCYITLTDLPWPFNAGSVEATVASPHSLNSAFSCDLVVPVGSVIENIDPNLS